MRSSSWSEPTALFPGSGVSLPAAPGVVGSLAGDRHVVHVALAQAGEGGAAEVQPRCISVIVALPV